MVTEEWIWTTFQVIVGYNLFMPFLLYCCWRLITSKRNTNIVASREPDYAIIVTAYEQTDSLYAVVDSISRLNYSNYIVYVVADNCDVTDLIFPDNRVMLLHPPETIASNTGSHFYAIRNFVRKHERLTIIDSDNLVHPEYLNELNRTFSQGFEAVQGVRKAKNLNSTLACLDAARDIYYNFYDGKLLFGLGSSATLAGSGMAFTVALYGRCLQDSSVSGAGFDKVLQAEIVGANERIAFCERAWVYDEKTSGSDQLVNQRARWISTWFRFFSKGFRILIKGVKNASFNQFLFGLILLRPPLFIFLILSVCLTIIDLFVQPALVPVWIAGFISFISAFVIALKKSDADPKIYKALNQIPVFMILQLKALVSSRNASKRSVATRHFQHSEITDINTKQ